MTRALMLYLALQTSVGASASEIQKINQGDIAPYTGIIMHEDDFRYYSEQDEVAQLIGVQDQWVVEKVLVGLVVGFVAGYALKSAF